MQRWGAEYTQKFDVHTVGAQLLQTYREALHKRRRT
jgi:hypothetical protein